MDNRFLTKVQSNLLDKIIIFSVSKKKIIFQLEQLDIYIQKRTWLHISCTIYKH